MKDNMPAKQGSISCTQMLCHLLDQEHDKGAAIMSLVERYINHFARRYCNLSFHERQDIRQEVAISLLCHGKTMRENCPKSWVYTVVRNQCIAHVRKQTKHLTVFKSTEHSNTESHVTGPVPAFNEGVEVGVIQQIDCLQKVFDQIEAQETGKADIAIYTQYAFGLSYVEISKRSKRTVDAIGRRISVLKGRLKKLMNECC